jgi:BA14K-like protein
MVAFRSSDHSIEVEELTMNNKIKAIGAAAIAGLVSLAAVAPAAAAPSPWWLQHHYRHYGHHWAYRGAPGPYYGPGYYYGYGYDPGAAVASGLIGGIFGAIAGTMLTHAGGGSHIWRCEHAYRTYSPSSNTYMGYDGYRHACTL